MDQLERAIREWITEQHCESGGLTCDSIHIDLLHAVAAGGGGEWHDAAIYVLTVARGVANDCPEEVGVAVGWTLMPGAEPSDIDDVIALRDLLSTADWAPPNLFIYSRGQEPWSAPDVQTNCYTITANGRPLVLTRAEWFAPTDNEFRRAVWLQAV